jgi:hypothetical protein
MATELLQPGITVIQEFRSVSPTIVTPTLVPCAVAPGFQVLEALATDATGNQVLNTDALVSAPAIQTSANPSPYAGLNTLKLKVSINNGPEQEFTFSDPTAANLSAAQVADQINGATVPPTGFAAYAVTKNGSVYVQLRTIATGDGQFLKVLNGTANSILGFNNNVVAEGISTYSQDEIMVEQLNFPDPRDIIAELDVDEDSIRAFVNTGKALREFLRTESFLRKKKEAIHTSAVITFPTTTLTGKKFSFKDGIKGAVQEYTFVAEYATNILLVAAMNAFIGSTRLFVNGSTKIDFITPEGYFEVITPTSASAHAILGWTDGAKAYTVETVDDGDGDNTTPTIVVDRDNFALAAGSARLTGTVTIATPIAIHNKTFQVAKDGYHMQEVVFDAGPIVAGAIFVVANVLSSLVLNLKVNNTTYAVTFTGVNPLSITDAINQINATVGVTVAYRSLVTGVASPTGTYISYQVGGGTPIAGGSVELIFAASTAWTDLGLTGVINLVQEMTLAEIITQINATLGTGFSSNVTNLLRLDSTTLGDQSKIEIGVGTANASFGFTSGAVDTGDAFPPKIGDTIYGDGVLIGNIIAVAPGGNNTHLKLDREVALTYGSTAMYIQAKNIPDTLPADRPTPDLVIDAGGAVKITHDFLRDIEGNPLLTGQGQLLFSYKALRLDVSPAAVNPALLSFNDVTVLEETLSPLNTDNPLGLMLYFMLINAPGIQVTGIGVDGTSDSNPDGTPLAYSKALTFLEAKEVYALAPATQDPSIHQSFVTHVNAMSAPEAGGERVVLICPHMPDEALPALVTSGTDGDSTVTLNEFDTKLSSLSADLLAAGINPVGTIPVSDGVYLDIASDSKKYSIMSVSGTKVMIRVVFAPGENDDGFYSTTNLSLTLLSETFSINIRGAALETPTGDPDYQAISEQYQALGQVYGNRRVVMLAPERVGANIDAVEQIIPGYYLAAALAGMTGQLPPQQGFTNFPITGFTRAIGSNDVFSRKQMNVGAAGGTWWVVQNTAGAPLQTRHQVTTDLTSIETREYSITKIVDFVAKFMRAGLRNFIGKFNITQPFLDSLSTVVQGQLSFLTESGVLLGGDLNNIVQDKDAPDTVLIDVTLDVPYPCNYIRLTLVI